MKILRKIFFVYISSKLLKYNNHLTFNDLNFKKLDFTNYKQIKSFIFKEDFHKLKNRYVQSFEFLNFSKNLGGKLGINLSKVSILEWFVINKKKIGYPWTEDLSSKRLINLLYNYEFINSSSTVNETKLLNKIILFHMNRVMFDFRHKNIDEITSYDLIAYTLSIFVLDKNNDRNINYLDLIINNQIDSLGMHKSYNILEHAKFLNNISELKNICLYFKYTISNNLEESIFKMKSLLNEYFHFDGSIPLFNGANNNYTKTIYESLNKEEFFKSRSFSETKNGLAFYSSKTKKLFFDVVQPKKNKISQNLSAGTLAFEFSCLGEKIITNCGASESLGRNPEYLRYSAAHSTIIVQNTNVSEIREGNHHLKYPQYVSFHKNISNKNTFFEGSHNGYQKKFNKIIKRKIEISDDKNKIIGKDTIISVKNNNDRIIYHIRFHLAPGMSYNFTNGMKNIILKTKLDNIWLFKCDAEVVIEDSILVDNNTTIPTKQIVLKGVINTNKLIKTWSLEKI